MVSGAIELARKGNRTGCSSQLDAISAVDWTDGRDWTGRGIAESRLAGQIITASVDDRRRSAGRIDDAERG